jgi:hypothetical protein
MRAHFHPFLWMIADGDKHRRDWPFQVRDALALREISAALRGLGYEDGRDLLNHPPAGLVPPEELAPIHTPWSHLHDLLVSCTRIPIWDQAQGARKQVPRGYTDLEKEIMDEWMLYAASSRVVVQVHDRLHQQFPPGKEDRRRVQLYTRALAPYASLSSCDGRRPRKYDGDEIRTPVFLLRIPKMQHRRMGYLGIWGPDGNTTLIWATLLRFRYPELLATNHFVMGELVGGPIPERPFDLDFCGDWDVEFLIDEPIRRGGKGSPRASVPVGAPMLT